MNRHFIDLEDPKQVAVAWSYIAEPGDTSAGYLRNRFGSREALEWVMSSFQDFGESGPWEEKWSLWSHRMLELDEKDFTCSFTVLRGRVILPSDHEWPAQLNDLRNAAPPALWAMGEGRIDTPSFRTISIMGSRACTRYGQDITEKFAEELSSQGATILSGGSYGIEAAAIRGALAASNYLGSPVRSNVFLSGGLERLYPAGNLSLFNSLLEAGGSIVSELPPSATPSRERFINRNRLLVAMSGVLLVPEAGLRSGALAAAKKAESLRRNVAAIPGPITSVASQGPHRLIQDGVAELVTDSEDVFRSFRSY